MGPEESQVRHWTDSYFKKTKAAVERYGDVRATYAVFMRRPVISAPRLMVDWLQAMAAARDTEFEIELTHEESAWVGAGEPMMYILSAAARPGLCRGL
jgi:nicotinate phosphoribosyltransferase